MSIQTPGLAGADCAWPRASRYSQTFVKRILLGHKIIVWAVEMQFPGKTAGSVEFAGKKGGND